MDTLIVKMNSENIDNESIKKAGEIIREGGLVAFPTETVYGLGANALNKEAAKKIYAAKGRPSDNPLIAHIANEEMLKPLVKEIPEVAKKLMDAFWPGPMTLIFNKSDIVPKDTTGGLDTVAIRMPNHPIAQALIKEAGVSIAAPSANLSGKPSPTLGEHVIDDMDGRIDMIIDGGMVGMGLESTIIDVTVEPPMILRPGFITKEMLKEVIDQVETDKAILTKPTDGLRPKAPGMKYRHYAPKADFRMYDGEEEKVANEIIKVANEKDSQGYVTGILTSDQNKHFYEGKVNDGVVIVSLGMFTKKVQSSYQKLLQENFKLLDENQIRRIAGLLNVSRRVFVYGMGSSGNVAEEFQLRFMRIGLDVTAVTDSQMIQMSAALVEERMLVIAISLSGTTREIVESIRIAKSRNAKVIFITANPAPETAARCDEVLRVAYLKNLDTGTKISPQFSILVMIDILYSYYFANDSYFKAQKYKETLSAIQGKHKGAMEDVKKGENPE